MIDIIVGGQGGDEGKGDITRYLAEKGEYSFAAKVGGPNAGHSTYVDGKKLSLRTVPCAFTNPLIQLYIPAGSYINPDWFLAEVEKTGCKNRIFVDHYTPLITQAHLEEERANTELMKGIGSVGTGLGMAVRDRVMRKKDLKFAKDDERLSSYCTDIAYLIHLGLKNHENGLIEGTQGFKLDLIHSGEYPFTTSRSTIASSFAGEAGVGPKEVRDVWVIYKPYETRVGPGPLTNEIFDEKLLEKYHTAGGEIGSVSGRLRRAGKFDAYKAVVANRFNGATKLAITHLDMLDGFDKDFTKLTGEAKEFIEIFKNLELTYPYPKLGLIKTGPLFEDIVDLR
jgi:adenylosuccinate synthase